MAVQRQYKDKDGNRTADFLPVVTWRQTADYCNKYLKKGSRVAVEGSIQKRSYQAQDGSNRYVTEIIADHVEGLGSPNAQQGGQPAQEQPDPSQFTEVDDDELPF